MSDGPREVLDRPGGREFRYDLAYAEVIERWRRDAAFADQLQDLLSALPFRAVFWETPPISVRTVDRRFGFVAIDAPSLADVAPEPGPFAAPWARAAPGPVATFPNLGRDAILVVPRPAPERACPHLLAFVRTASRDDHRALWRAVGEAVAARLSDRPVWVSTAGTGVFWLHVRLDDRPKYYQWRPYRDDPG